MKPTVSYGRNTIETSPDFGSREFPPEIFQFFFDTYLDPLMICLRDGRILRSNRAAEKLLGYSEDELVQLPAFALLPDHVADKLPALLQKEQKKGGLTIEIPILTKSGEPCNVEFRTRLFRFHTHTLRTIILHPFHNLNSADSAIRTVSGKSTELSYLLPSIFAEPEMVFEFDTDGFFTMANNLCFEKTGYTKNDLKRGVQFTQLLTPEEIERGRRDFRRLLRNEKLDALEYTILRKDGTALSVLLSLTKIISENEVKGIRGVALDISEHKRVEQSLMVREKLNILGELAGGVVHNFNNILTVILGYIDIFPFESADESSREILHKIRRAALDGAEIVKRVKNFSQVRESSEREASNMNEIIRDVLEFMKPRLSAAQRPITVNTRLEPIPPVLIIPFELREVLCNVVINSIDAMPSGGSITITTGAREKFVSVTVADTGIGMSGETKQHLFEPFFTTKKNRGTGIGLSVSYAIISKFGGKIWVDSEKGAGTVITIMLPAADAAKPSFVKDDTRPPVSPARSILVIDDEENICEILGEYLTREGHDVVTTQNGEKGLEILGQRRFDIVITDLNMPRISGWDIAHRIKKSTPETVTIMLTGWGTTIEELNRRENIVDHLIFKPINFSALSCFITEMVTGK